MNSLRGFTLLETLVWITVFTTTMIAISTSVLYFYRTSDATIEQATALTSTQRGIDEIVQVIREAAYSSVGAYPIVSLATSSLTFYANIDTDSSIERVRYYLSDTTLSVGILNPVGDPASYVGTEDVSLIADNIRNVSEGFDVFTYYDTNGDEMVDLSQIDEVRFVTVTLVADLDPNRAPVITTLRSSAAMRNLIE